jgi:alkanesulfonate monooxygenase SsuD/methylene tetrahydromethanopterin reductase-like flavin-dependent oxidoreductase (luciferase family)
MTPPSTPRLGIAIPQVAVGDAPACRLARFLESAESAGFDGLWVQEDILTGRGTLEPLSLLTFAAGLTRTIPLGVATLLTSVRNAVQLAKSLATIDVLSGGRLIVGAALGAETASYPAFGLSSARRVNRFVESLHLMRELWRGEPVWFDGETARLRGEVMTPVPRQRPGPPIWIGGHSSGAVERAVRLGDGFVGAGASTTAEFAACAATIVKLRAQMGHDAFFPLAKRVFVAVDRDGSRARRQLTDWLACFYGDAERAERIALAGTPEACVEGIQQVIRAGASDIILNFVANEEHSLDLTATEILPQLRRVGEDVRKETL